MKFLWFLQTIQVALLGGMIWLWALFKSADRKSFYQKTIRIVSIDSSSKNQPQQNDIWEAIKILQQRDLRRLRRIIEHISLVFVRSKGVHGIYLRTGRVCVLNLTSLKSESSARDRQIAIAGLLVHEATHGAIDKLQIPYFGSLVERIEKLCDDEQKRCVKRLAEYL